VKTDKQVERGKNLYPNGIDWPVSLWLVSLHVGALFAPFTFTWTGLILAVALHWITGGLGICFGYHRLFTHTSFKTYRPVRWMLAFVGGLAGEGGVDDWVAIHRAHHAMSDQVGDPHSPRDGGWWSHMLWIARARPDREAFNKKWAPDLSRDPVLSFICRRFLSSHIVFGLLVLGAATLYGGWQFGASVTVWAIFLRLCAVLHVTWLVNSASHMWGYQNYETNDDSRNNWLVALLGYGEGWHNNHHAFPRMANHGHRWWEFDVTYRTIRACALVGLVWDIVDYRNHAEKA
jgi:stearoyl-CoA desaturase (delta-9 desaturase)